MLLSEAQLRFPTSSDSKRKSLWWIHTGTSILSITSVRMLDKEYHFLPLILLILWTPVTYSCSTLSEMPTISPLTSMCSFPKGCHTPSQAHAMYPSQCGRCILSPAPPRLAWRKECWTPCTPLMPKMSIHGWHEVLIRAGSGSGTGGKCCFGLIFEVRVWGSYVPWVRRSPRDIWNLNPRTLSSRYMKSHRAKTK